MISQVCLTDQHLAVLMDVALGGNLTSYVSDQYKHAERHGLFLTEVTRTYRCKTLPVRHRLHKHRLQDVWWECKTACQPRPASNPSRNS